jgi:hypothetical protein
MPHDTDNKVSAGEIAMEISVDCDYRLLRSPPQKNGTLDQ